MSNAAELLLIMKIWDRRFCAFSLSRDAWSHVAKHAGQSSISLVDSPRRRGTATGCHWLRGCLADRRQPSDAARWDHFVLDLIHVIQHHATNNIVTCQDYVEHRPAFASRRSASSSNWNLVARLQSGESAEPHIENWMGCSDCFEEGAAGLTRT